MIVARNVGEKPINGMGLEYSTLVDALESCRRCKSHKRMLDSWSVSASGIVLNARLGAIFGTARWKCLKIAHKMQSYAMVVVLAKWRHEVSKRNGKTEIESKRSQPSS